MIIWLLWHWDIQALTKGYLMIRLCPLIKTIGFTVWRQAALRLGLPIFYVMCEGQSSDVEGVALKEGDHHFQTGIVWVWCTFRKQQQAQWHLEIAVLWDWLLLEKWDQSLLLSTCPGVLRPGRAQLTLTCGQEGLNFLSSLLKHTNGTGKILRNWKNFTLQKISLDSP